MLATVYSPEFTAPVAEAIPSDAADFARRLYLKSNSKRLLSYLGFPVAKTYCEGASAADLMDICRSQDAMVVKPVHGKNGWGVLSLVSAGSNRWFCVQMQRDITTSEVFAAMTAVAVRRRLKPVWLAEELLLPPGGAYGPVNDIKLYTFYGRGIVLVLHKSNAANGARYRWYDRDWHPTDTGKYNDRLDQSLRPPLDAMQYEQLALAISPWVLRPFCRVDLMETSRGPVVGELTLKPGSPEKFLKEIQSALFARWKISREVLLQDIQAGYTSDAVDLYRKLGNLHYDLSG